MGVGEGGEEGLLMGVHSRWTHAPLCIPSGYLLMSVGGRRKGPRGRHLPSQMERSSPAAEGEEQLLLP